MRNLILNNGDLALRTTLPCAGFLDSARIPVRFESAVYAGWDFYAAFHGPRRCIPPREPSQTFDAEFFRVIPRDFLRTPLTERFTPGFSMFSWVLDGP